MERGFRHKEEKEHRQHRTWGRKWSQKSEILSGKRFSHKVNKQRERMSFRAEHVERQLNILAALHQMKAYGNKE